MTQHSTETASRIQNYSAASGVVNIAGPESSLLLNTPRRRLDDGSVGTSQQFSPGGGLRWPDGKQSSEYRAILRSIQAERPGLAHA